MSLQLLPCNTGHSSQRSLGRLLSGDGALPTQAANQAKAFSSQDSCSLRGHSWGSPPSSELISHQPSELMSINQTPASLLGSGWGQ